MEGKKCVVPREVCAECPERGNHHHEVMLNAQKSAEAIVPEKGRAESVGVFSTTRKGGMSTWVQKTRKKAAHKEIARNVKGM
jgi:hypothetical protein